MKKLIILILGLLSLFLVACGEKKENVESSKAQESKGSVYSSFKANWQGDTLVNIAELPEYVYQEGDQFNIGQNQYGMVELPEILTLNGESFTGVLSADIHKESETAMTKVIFIEGKIYDKEGIYAKIIEDYSEIELQAKKEEVEFHMNVAIGSSRHLFFAGEWNKNMIDFWISKIIDSETGKQDSSWLLEMGGVQANYIQGATNGEQLGEALAGNEILCWLIENRIYEAYGKKWRIIDSEGGYWFEKIK